MPFVLRPLTAAASVLALAVAGCTSDKDAALVEALDDAGATTLVAPTIDGEEPEGWRMDVTGAVTLSWKEFDGALTIGAPPDDVCAAHAEEYDRCTELSPGAWRLSFEEQDGVAVLRDGREMLWSGFSLEVPDEDYASTEEMLTAIDARVDDLVDAARDADLLTPEEFVDAVPDGTVAE